MRALSIALIIAGLSNPFAGGKNPLAKLWNPQKTEAKSEKKAAATEAGARLVMFVGVDISGSFLNGRYFDDSIRFLARYLHAHLKGYGGLEVPSALFVGSIGGIQKEEAKTLYPIQTFEDRSIDQIEAELRAIFPKNKINKYTDYNSFFEQVTDMVDTRKLILKPISIILLTDGIPDVGGDSREEKFRNLALKPLERLSRNITLRVLYTDAVTAKQWRDEVPRKRVKVWTQDAVVMDDWKSPRILLADTPASKQEKYFAWVRENVDFMPRLKPVDEARPRAEPKPAPRADAKSPRPWWNPLGFGSR